MITFPRIGFGSTVLTVLLESPGDDSVLSSSQDKDSPESVDLFNTRIFFFEGGAAYVENITDNKRKYAVTSTFYT